MSVERHSVDADHLEQYRQEYTSGEEPRLSIVVPVYDDPEGLSTTLDSITSAGFRDHEAVVVVTPSTGDTHRVARNYATGRNWLTVAVEDQHCTPGAARNVGIERASGDVLVFIDADMTLGDEYLWSVSYLFETTDVDYLGCPVEMRSEDEVLSRVGWYDQHIRFPVEPMLDLLEFCPTCCLSTRADVFDDGFRFDSTLTASEDVVFGRQVRAAGYQFGFCPDVVLTHPVRNSLTEIIAKGVKTGRGTRQLYTSHPELYQRDTYWLFQLAAYAPPSADNLRNRCDSWESLDWPQRALIFAFAYLENLATTWGHVRELLDTWREVGFGAQDPGQKSLNE